MAVQSVAKQIQAFVREQSGGGGRAARDMGRWRELFQALQASHASMAVEDAGEQRAVLTFLRELPQVCPSHASQAASVARSLAARDSWAASAQSLAREGAAPPAQQGAEDGAVSRRVEEMISAILGPHPDADVLVPLALLEVATEDEHRQALEARMSEPHRFRQYLLSMVSAVSAELPMESEKLSAKPDVVPHAEVRTAYLQLAKQYHPDKGGDHDMFITLQTAYELLRADHVTAKD